MHDCDVSDDGREKELLINTGVVRGEFFEEDEKRGSFFEIRREGVPQENERGKV